MTSSDTTTRPDLTPEIVKQLRAFGTGDIYPVTITRTVKSRAGNIIIAAGTETWGMDNKPPTWVSDRPQAPSIGVWTGHTHYAGCKSSSVPTKSVRVDVVPG